MTFSSNIIFKKSFLALLIILSNIQSIYSLTLDRYLQQVGESNDSFKSNELLMQAGFIRSEEGFLILMPHLIGNFNYLNDGQEPISVPLRGHKTQREDYNIGVVKKFETGTNVKVEYHNNYTDISNPNPNLVRHNRTWFSSPVLTLEQPLLKDWMGSQTKALINLKNSQMLADGHSKKFLNQTIMTEAKKVYWDLATTKATIRVKEDSVERYQTLFDWTNKRTHSGLGNSSDEFQAEAGLLTQQYELQALKDYEKTKARLFNALRNIQSDVVTDKLTSYNTIDLKTFAPKDKTLPPAIREDLNADYHAYLSAKAKTEVAEQDLTSAVNLNLKYFPSGRETHYQNAASEALRAQNNTLSVGVNFNIPLDLKLKKNLLSAYKAERYAAELAYSRKKFEVTNEWQQLANQFDILLHQLELVTKLEQTQHKKLHNERDLLTKGRSDTFKIIQFEQDYLGTQAQLYNTKNKLLNLIALMQLFDSK